MEEHAAAPEPRDKQETRFTEEEINSYLAFNLQDGYHPSLKSLKLRFEEDGLSAMAEVDFDQLKTHSQKMLARIMAGLFSGVHRLSVGGRLIAEAGRAHFQLEEAHFDGSTLPNFLVEEIISAVGSRQKPPIDPLTPSPIPYGIKEVDVRPGQIVVHQ